MATKRSRSLVWSYFDLLDPNRVLVIPGGFTRLQLAAASLDWGSTSECIGARIDPTSTETQANGDPLPEAINTRWMIPNGVVQSRGGLGNATVFPLTGTMPGNYFTSFSTTYATRVPPFVSLIIEGVDAPDGRVAVLSPGNQSINGGLNGVVFNITDKNMKVRLVDPWGKTINNMTFTATITLLE